MTNVIFILEYKDISNLMSFMLKTSETKIVDCNVGRSLGCSTFCCRLWIRLKPHEREPSDGHTASKGFIDKDEHGYCIHIDQTTWMCGIWENRPEVCREYSCNHDPLLQVVLAEGFTNIVDISKKALANPIPKELHKYIPDEE